MKGESGVTRSIIDELRSCEIQGDLMEGENSVTPSIIDQLLSWDIQGDQKESEDGVTRSINDELHSSDMVKWKVKVLLLGVSLMHFILEISKEIKRKMKVA